MLDGKKVKISTGGNFDPLPMDRYTVQIIDVDLITQLKYKSTEEEDVLNYKFVVLDDKPMPEKEGEKAETTRGRFLWRRCRLAINDRSHWGKLIKAVIGRDLTKEEVEGFDPESLVGQQVDVMVAQSEGKDGTIYANVTDFSKTLKKLAPIDPETVTTAKPVKKSTKTVVPTVAPAADDGEETPEEFAKKLEDEADEPDKEEVSVSDEDELAALEAKAAVAAKKAEIAKKKRLAVKAK